MFRLAILIVAKLAALIAATVDTVNAFPRRRTGRPKSAAPPGSGRDWNGPVCRQEGIAIKRCRFFPGLAHTSRPPRQAGLVFSGKNGGMAARKGCGT